MEERQRQKRRLSSANIRTNDTSMMMMVTEKSCMITSKNSHKLHGYNGPLCFMSPEDPDRISPTTASGSTATTVITSQYNERFTFIYTIIQTNACLSIIDNEN